MKLLVVLLVMVGSSFASIQCLRGIDQEQCATDGRKLLNTITLLRADKLMPSDWVYTIVADKEWGQLKEKLGSPSNYAVTAPWLRRTFFRQGTIENLTNEDTAFVAAHEMAHIICSLPMDKEKKANEVAHRLMLSRSTDIAGLCH